MPRTATFKVLTRLLAADRWNTGDPVWWRPDGRSPAYVPLGTEQAATLDAALRASVDGRSGVPATEDPARPPRS
jgi:UDP:flavonoid glycosyltransferase YjiC (YdhE family)